MRAVRTTFGALLTVILGVCVYGQQTLNTPHVAYVYPAGGQQGTTFEVTVAGQFLDDAHDVYVSGTGVKAEVVQLRTPMKPAELTQSRDLLKDLREKRKSGLQLSPQEVKTGSETAQKLAFTLKRRPTPAIQDVATVRVKIAPDAAPGKRELRITGRLGISNPLVFYVDQLAEVSKEPAANVQVKWGEFNVADFRNQQTKPVEATPAVSITMPVIVNGEIMPGGVDSYKFQARKGQKLVIAARTRELIPYISDAVPGWFQAALSLVDAKGKEVAYADHYGFQQDPVLLYDVAEDGEYTLQVRDSIYRGREDFVYRISIGELPFVTSVFPLGGKAGSRTRVELTGWNLPVTSTTVSMKEAGRQTFAVQEGPMLSNSLLLDAGTSPEISEKSGHSSAAHAQELKLPVAVNGRISTPDEWDVYKFEGRKGDEIVAEVVARRLGSPLDSILRVTDASGKQLASNDDYEDKSAALLTHQADSRIAFKLPAKGTYYLHLGDTQHKGGPEFGYRLQVHYAQPDFELRVVPSSVSLRPGLTLPVTVYALRKDGFSGEITVKLKESPRGFVLSGGTIASGQDSVRMTVGAPVEQSEAPQSLKFEGEAIIGGKKVRHEGVPAEDMMQAFAWHHLVAQKQALVVVRGQGRRQGKPWQFAADKPVKLVASGTTEVKIGLPFTQNRNWSADRIQLELNGAPEGIAIKDVLHKGDTLAIVLKTEESKVKPGLKGNLIIDLFLNAPAQSKDGKQQAGRKIPMGVLPAIPFEVIGPAS